MLTNCNAVTVDVLSSVAMVEQCVSVYLDVVIGTDAGGGLQLEGSKGVVDSVSIAGLDGPAAL